MARISENRSPFYKKVPEINFILHAGKRKKVEEMDLETFYFLDVNTSMIQMTKVLKYDIFIAPQYKYSPYTFDNSEEIIDIMVFFQATCNPPVLFDSNLIFKLFSKSIFKIGMTEYVKIRDPTVALGAYPDWFPKEKATSLWRYDQDVCEALCYLFIASHGESIKFPNHTPNLSKNSSFFSNTLNFTDGVKLALTDGNTCGTVCPKNRDALSVNINANLFSQGSRFLKENQSEVFVTSATSKVVIKTIRQQKNMREVVSEIGGYMGLLIGASFVTLIEFLEYFLLLVLRRFPLKRAVENHDNGQELCSGESLA